MISKDSYKVWERGTGKNSGRLETVKNIPTANQIHRKYLNQQKLLDFTQIQIVSRCANSATKRDKRKKKNTLSKSQ